MRSLTALLLLVALLVVLPLAAGGPAGDVNSTVQDGKDLLDGLHGTADEVLDGVQDQTDDGPGLGSIMDRAVHAIGAAFMRTGETVVAVGAMLSGSVADAVIAVGAAAGSSLAWTGSTVTLGLWKGVTGITDGVVFLAGSVWTGLVDYVGFVGGLRPDTMPMPAFVAIAATGATASAGVGGWAGWNALRKWGSLGGLGALGGFSRIQDSDLLNHPLRNDIFTSIQQNPGIHASQLARDVGVGWGTITHHLDKLEKARLVTTRKVNNQKCYFEQGGEVRRQDMAIMSAVKGDTAASIASFVDSHPMTSQKALAEALGISPALASFHVKKLVRLGVLDKVRHGKETLLSTSEGLRRVLQSGDPAVAAALHHAEGMEFSS